MKMTVCKIFSKEDACVLLSISEIFKVKLYALSLYLICPSSTQLFPAGLV